MKESRYIRWAKSRMGIRYNLSRSGVRPCPTELLAAGPEDHAISGDNQDGWRPLVDRIARRHQVDAAQVVLAHGASMANHLACATILERGDEVLVEHPVYEPLQALPRYLNAGVRFFQRRPEDAYRIHPGAIEELLTPRTRLVVLSNLHNPTGALADPPALAELGRIAERKGFFVLVDEVYLEFLQDAGGRSAVRISPNFAATRSLTKASGLDGLRVGWVLAEARLAERMRRLNDLFSVTTAHPSERLAARALDRAGAISSWVRALLARNRPLVERFVDAHPRLSWTLPAAGTVGFVRLEGGSVDELVERLEADFDTTVTPGRFFGAADHFRLGFGMDTEVLEEGLGRLDAALG